ncbi:uncharacterized protein I303_105533 [Kwoniella dejecticola CBS 10117]|uniref:Golgi apparatus membrane protein TVP38 n=1 Tax=Kwoniella dejecticola CBS 10117 TaxID=1296121 RepID=A0A1A6A277_9TREE|nr:uncharacterized protein I303_05025 [Kwoniella dejecticola CBS 10117]OBR84168.1 hypothetical protein I303_05025 [Kwoniella dejecticola CBS 10117]
MDHHHQHQDQHPEISHPYPPSYRSQLSPPRDQSPLPRHQHGDQLNYQRRRDDRHNHSNHNNQLSVNDNPYLPSTSPDPSPSRPLYSSNFNPDSGRPTTRLQRSASESSTHPVLSDGAGKEYPAGWTKEDEEAEREFLKKGMVDWKKLSAWRFWIRKEWWYWYIIAIVGAVLVILMSLYHDEIVDWMTPFANWMKDLPGGWAIPIGIFFVISFPPLFGHEILAVLVGAVWGLWIGFGITAAGTLLGEIGNFYAFKYCLRSTAEKYEKNNLNYACMAHVVRDGGFWMIFIIRLSAIPGHFSTAVFATCGTGFWIFTIACVLTLPKQLIVVYLGVIFANDEDTKSSEKWISHGILIFGCLVTIWAAWYIWKKMHQARIHVWRKRRIEAASKGMILNEVPSKEWQNTENNHLDRPTVNVEEDDEATSPILHRHHHHHQHQSYQNPCDIRYQSQDDMSIYHVDGNTSASGISNNATQSYPYAQSTQSLGLGRPVEVEQDIGYAYKPSPSTDSLQPQPQPQPQASHVQFPQAQSTGTGYLKRNQTNATSYSVNMNGDDTAQFPVPIPTTTTTTQMYGHVDHSRDHARY